MDIVINFKQHNMASNIKYRSYYYKITAVSYFFIVNIASQTLQLMLIKKYSTICIFFSIVKGQ
jgi:hypothetical protein